MSIQTNQPDEKRFDRGARLTPFFVVAWLFFSEALLVYRTTLPNDGWISTEPDRFDAYGYIYTQDLMGIPSGLKVGDHLIAVEGISLDRPALDFSLFGLRPLWYAGNSVRYTVVRQGEELEIQVPLVHWQWSRFIQSGAISQNSIFGFLGVVIFLGMGVIAFLKRLDNPAARALLVLGAAWVSGFLVISLIPSGIYNQIFTVSTISIAILITTLFTVLAPPAFIRFGLVFPQPKPILKRLPWIAYLPYGIGGIGIIAFLNGLFEYGWIWTAASILITIFLLVHSSWTMRDAVSRAQMRWGLGGMLLGLAIFLSSYLPVFVELSRPVEDFLESWSVLGFAVMGVTLGIAILRYRLFDIDVIICRTLVYSLLTALLGLLYLATVTLLQALFTNLGGSKSTLAVVLSTLVIAALFTPLRRRIHEGIDRRFYRQKYNTEQSLARLAAIARNEVHIDHLNASMVRIIEETMQPEGISIWLQSPVEVRKHTKAGELALSKGEDLR